MGFSMMICGWCELHAITPSHPIIMSEIQFDNVDSIVSSFSELTDPRSSINRLHVFGDLLVICIMAVIAGADGLLRSAPGPRTTKCG